MHFRCTFRICDCAYLLIVLSSTIQKSRILVPLIMFVAARRFNTACCRVVPTAHRRMLTRTSSNVVPTAKVLMGAHTQCVSHFALSAWLGSLLQVACFQDLKSKQAITSSRMISLKVWNFLMFRTGNSPRFVCRRTPITALNTISVRIRRIC